MDVDGGELKALQGAESTLNRTSWLCVELVEWVPGHAERVHRFLHNRRFYVKGMPGHDGIYQRKRRRVPYTPLDRIRQNYGAK
jgi:hypothetical protein